ncbi:MAG: FAD-binding oxidoreductase [Alphaproteobacteria bacterium]|nr:FAD-binding oxidoreductase [Alphaproteobacteria bacterium]
MPRERPGRLGQSGRNLGWIRQQGRDPAELPLMVEACRLWKELGERCGSTALRLRGDRHQLSRPSPGGCAAIRDLRRSARGTWRSTREARPQADRAALPLPEQRWQYGLRTPGDRRVARLAAPAIANAVLEKGGRIFETCAVRSIDPGRRPRPDRDGPGRSHRGTRRHRVGRGIGRPCRRRRSPPAAIVRGIDRD